MTKTSLSSLYRRLTATAAPALEADEIAAASEGTLADGRRDEVAARLAASPADAKVARLLRELKTDSEALAFGIARIERDAGHDRQRTGHRTAAGRRHANVMRWTAAMAACLVAVVGVFTLRQPHTMSPNPAHTVARADVIFRDHELTRKTPAKGDELFRGNFNG
jgi:hypothetical protein